MILACIRNQERIDCFAIKLSEFRQLDRAIHRHLIRQAILKVCGILSGFGFEHIEAILDLAKSGGDGLRLHLPHQLTVRIEQDNLCFYLGQPKQNIAMVNEPVAVPGTTRNVPLGIELNTELYKPTSTASAKIRLNPINQAILDADKILMPITLRNWQPGDTFIPFGMKGKKKLHDFFINEKIPRTKRDKIPLLVSANRDILWVVGRRISEKYKVTSSTKRIMKIKFIKS